MTGLRLIVTAYFAILAIIFTASVVMSVDGLRESRLDALDNKYLASP